MRLRSLQNLPHSRPAWRWSTSPFCDCHGRQLFFVTRDTNAAADLKRSAARDARRRLWATLRLPRTFQARRGLDLGRRKNGRRLCRDFRQRNALVTNLQRLGLFAACPARLRRASQWGGPRATESPSYFRFCFGFFVFFFLKNTGQPFCFEITMGLRHRAAQCQGRAAFDHVSFFFVRALKPGDQTPCSYDTSPGLCFTSVVSPLFLASRG